MEERSNSHTYPTVLFLTRTYPPVTGGMERFSYELTTSIASRTKAHIIANRRGKKALPFFMLAGLARGLRLLKKSDVVHIGDPALASVAWMLKKSHPLPTLMTIHGLDILYALPFYQWSLKRFLPSVDMFICISHYVRDTLLQKFPSAHAIVIPPGIHDTLYDVSVTRADASRVLGEDIGDRPLLLTVGRLVPRKGAAWFVEHVLPLLPSNVLYIVVGKGPEEKQIRSAAETARVADRIRLVGQIDQHALQVLFNAADVFVMPNILRENDAEGFGLVAIEAASCRTPVVASAIEGIVDAVYDGRNGRLVETGNASQFAEAIKGFLADPEARRAFGERAREFTLKHFSWNIIARQYLEAYEQARRV